MELLESEIATMIYIRRNISVPVPVIFDHWSVNLCPAGFSVLTNMHSSTASNPIGIPFILMSKALGTQLENFGWPFPTSDREVLGTCESPCLAEAQKEKIMHQLGAITSQLLDLQFDKLGSLFEKVGEYQVGKCLSPGLTFHHRDTLGSDIPHGPFHNDSEYYEALLLAFEAHAQSLRLPHNVFFAPVPTITEFKTRSSTKAAIARRNDLVTVGYKLDSTRNRLDYCIVKHLLQEIIPHICVKS